MHLYIRFRLGVNFTAQTRVLHELGPKQFHGGLSPFELCLGDVCRQIRTETGHGCRRGRDWCIRDSLRLVDKPWFCHGLKVSIAVGGVAVPGNIFRPEWTSSRCFPSTPLYTRL